MALASAASSLAGKLGLHLAQCLRLAPQPRDHHLLRVSPLKRQLAGEHLEAQDAQGVDVAAGVERLCRESAPGS